MLNERRCYCLKNKHEDDIYPPQWIAREIVRKEILKIIRKQNAKVKHE